MLPEYPEEVRRQLARNILTNSLRVRRGENLLVETWTATLPWAESLVLEARILGARPMLVVEDEETYWKSVAQAPAAHVGQVGSHDWAALKASNAHVYFYGPMDSQREEALPRSVLNRIDATDHEWFRLAAEFGVRSARWDLGRSSEYWAKRYGIDLGRWREELLDAALLDPRTMQRDGGRVGDAFRRGKEARITHPNGTDLTLHLRGRRPKVDDGVVDDADVKAGNVATVVPAGVTSVAVDETFAEGTFVADETPGVLMAHGHETPLAGGVWTFRGGRLVEYAHEGGGEEFRKHYERLGAGKDRPGQLSIGLNPKITSIPLLFDQARGVVTISVGRNSYAGGATRTPRFVAFQSLRGSTVEIDGRTILSGGEIA
jgi:leucyl aminopeptidase (aminopeptidase T)